MANDKYDTQTLEMFPETTAPAPRQETAGLVTSSSQDSAPATATIPRQETAGLRTSSRVFAVDPGQREGSTILYPSGCTKVEDFLEFVRSKAVRAGDKIATEATGHLYRPEDRYAVINAADEKGVEIWAMRSIFTSRARKEVFGTSKKEKNDPNNNKKDAKAILHYFLTRPNLFYRLKAAPKRLGTINEAGTPRFDLNRQLVLLRRDGYPGFANHISATIYAACMAGLQYSLSSRDFDRLLGFCACGYPNLARSNRNKHGAGNKPELRQGKMKEIRKQARRAYSVFRATATIPRQETAGLRTSSPEKVS